MTNTDKPVLDGEYRVEEGANSHAFDLRIIDPSGRCIAFADEPEASQIAAALSAPTKPLPEAGREGQLDRLFHGGGEYVRADEATKTIMALQAEVAALKAASAQSSVEEGPTHEDYAAIGRATVSAIEAVQAEYPQLADWTPAECYSEIIGDLAEKAFPEQGGREAVAWRYWNGDDPKLGVVSDRRLTGYEHCEPLGPLTIPRSEEDIRKAVVDECKAIIERTCSAEFSRTVGPRLAAALHSPADRSAK